MKNTLLFGLVLLASCKKTNLDIPIVPFKLTEKQSCDFGITSFNLIKRPPLNGETNDVILSKLRSGNNTTNPPAGTGVIYLDFNGERVSGSMWNTNGSINCAPANLSASAMNEIIQRVTNDFSAFKVLVTTDEAIFKATLSKRMRVIITESWEWWGQAGGVAFIGTFTAGSTTPCFVFSSLLNYSTKAIAEAVSHETGHTLGLDHQSSYINGVKIAEYNSGQGTGEIGWAPIMGSSYSKNLSLWHNGPTSMGATDFQNDISVITASLGSVTDDYSNSISGAVSLTSTLNAVINNSTDLDFFSVNLDTTTTLTLIPFNVGVNNAGANIDLILRIYDSQLGLIDTIDYANLLNAAIVLSPGTYFISVGTVSNLYTTTYGMNGKYSIRIN